MMDETGGGKERKSGLFSQIKINTGKKAEQ